MPVMFRILLIATCASVAFADTTAEEAEALGTFDRIFAALAQGGEKQILSFTDGENDTSVLLRALHSIQSLMRRPPSQPMSELSPPLLRVRSLRIVESDRARACVEMVRIGSVLTTHLGWYDMTLSRESGRWRLASAAARKSCRKAEAARGLAPDAQAP